MNIIEYIKNTGNQDNRIDWDEYFMSIAHLVSMRSPSTKLRVGAVIVKDSRIISTGYNGFPSGRSHTSISIHDHEMNTIHAEINAICDAAKRGVEIDNSSIYITHYPCIHCLKSIISSGIKEIYYYQDYKNNEYSKKLLDYLLDTNIKLVKLQ